VSLESEKLLRPLLTGEFNHVVDEILEDMEVPVFVCLRKVAPGYMATDIEMVTLKYAFIGMFLVRKKQIRSLSKSSLALYLHNIQTDRLVFFSGLQ